MFCLGLTGFFGGGSKASVRKPAVAGQFYPGDPEKLRLAVEGFLGDAVAPRGERPLVLVVPHAGYVYSGQIAADAFRQAADHRYDTVVVLGTNHTTPGLDVVSVYDGDGFRTPLGTAPIDRDLVQELLAASVEAVTRPEVHVREHSIEVQIPFTQVLFPQAKIVPAVVGSPDPDLCQRFGRVLAGSLAGRSALIVASSDLSHYPGYEDAVATDHAVLTAMAGLDPAAFRRALEEGLRARRPGLSTCACGEAPILVAMEAGRRLGARRGVVLSYANSGDTSLGDRERVVGYGAVMFTAGAEGPDRSILQREESVDPAEPLRGPEKSALLDLARSSIRRYLVSETLPLARNRGGPLARKQGAFVTLKKRGELRGCVGHPLGDTPLAQVVAGMAFQAAFNDGRFSPLELQELDEIEISISVLSPLIPVPGPEAVRVGTDGVWYRHERGSAILLPELARERGWSREEFLDHVCLKAGLAAKSWREGGEIHTFQTETLRERDAE